MWEGATGIAGSLSSLVAGAMGRHVLVLTWGSSGLETLGKPDRSKDIVPFHVPISHAQTSYSICSSQSFINS